MMSPDFNMRHLGVTELFQSVKSGRLPPGQPFAPLPQALLASRQPNGGRMSRSGASRRHGTPDPWVRGT